MDKKDTAKVTIHQISPDLSLREIVPDDLDSLPSLKKLREEHFKSGDPKYPESRPEICIELARLMTEYLKEYDCCAEARTDSPELRAGKMYKYILENKAAVIHDDDLLAGTTTSKRIGVHLHPDMYAISLWPELETVSSRPRNPFRISKQDIRELSTEIFPYWMERTIFERARKQYHNPECQQLMERVIFFLAAKATAVGHTIPNYAEVVNKGFKGIWEDFKKAEEKERQATNDRRKIAFYQGVQLAFEGIMAYARNLSREARCKSWHDDDEFARMSEVCGRIATQAPQTFREAVNAFWLSHVALHQETINFALSPGRLDQVLYPPFQDELESARKKGKEEAFLKEAIELVGCLWLKMCDHVPWAPEASEELLGGTGSNQAVTVGGVDEEGKDAVNDLTYVMLRATELLKLRDPNLNARYHPEVNPPEYLERLCQVNVTTKATPCFHNDKAVIEILTAHLKKLRKTQGASEEEEEAKAHARDYGTVGCVEPESCGRTFGHNGALSLSLPAVLEMALYRGRHRLTGTEQIGPVTKDPEKMCCGEKGFEEFKAAFQEQLQWLMDQATTLNNNLGRVYQEHHPFPILSALKEGCRENGKDVVQGGATYNSSGIWIIGLAEVVDSLTAIENFIFDGSNPHRVSFRDMLMAIDTDWLCDQKLHTRIKTHPDKFGTDGPRALKNARWLMRLLHDTAQSLPHYRGGKYTVGYYTMTSHAGYGALSRALPSGRKDHEPFPSGITPVSWASGCLTSVFHFIAGLPQDCIINGQALNLKFTPPPPGARPGSLEKYIKKFAHHIDTYFNKLGNEENQLGGLQTQFNIMDRQSLREARQHPERYPDLFVRVSGYSAYFKDLNPKMQEEIISRAEHDLGFGWPVPDTAPEETGPKQEAASPKPKSWLDILWFLVNSLLFRLCVFSRKGISSRVYRLGPQFIRRQAVERLLDRGLAEESAEEFLKVLLCCMDLLFKIDPEYRKNIENFTGTILFRDKSGRVGVVANFADEDLDWWEVTFKNGKMRPAFFRRVAEVFGPLFEGGARPVQPDATLVFKDGHALLYYLINYVISEEPNFLQSVLDNEIRPRGNTNYLYKFLFMANHPLLELRGKL